MGASWDCQVEFLIIIPAPILATRNSRLETGLFETRNSKLVYSQLETRNCFSRNP